MRAIFDNNNRNRISIRAIGTVACLLIICLVCCTCGSVSLTPPFGIEMPRVTGFSYTWGSVTDSSAGVNLQLKVFNPNPVSVGLSRLTAKVYLNDINVADITQQGDATLTAQQDTSLNLMLLVHTDQAGACIASHINQGESSQLLISGTANIGSGWFSFPYPFTWEHSFNTSIFGYLTAVQSMKLPLPGVSIVGINSAWGDVTDDQIQTLQDIEVLNQGQNPINLSVDSYRISANGIEMIDGSAGGPITLSPGYNEIRLTNIINTSGIPRYLASYVNDGESTTLHMEFQPGGPVRDYMIGRIPIEEILNNGGFNAGMLEQMLQSK